MSKPAFILLLMEDQAEGERLRDALRDHGGHSCRVVNTLEEATSSIEAKPPDVVVTTGTIQAQPVGPTLAKLLDRTASDAALLILGDNPAAVSTRHIDLLLLPEKDDVTNYVAAIDRAANSAASRRDDRLLSESFQTFEVRSFEGIVGETPEIKTIIERIKKAARNKLTVLILGETGSGKDLIAEAIHRQSDRGNKPFQPLNCAGLNENLLESSLFGHVKGAFTGAVNDRKGFFEAADGGTLFLDEIGDMPLTMQAKLLRALERREITPVGSTEVRRVDVRVIAATNVDLHKGVETKSFREDLYYRLNQWVIKVPPLRARRDDIPALAAHFLQNANATHGVNCPGLTSEAMETLTRYSWPGNVRELANLIESLAVEVEDHRIQITDLPDHVRGPNEIVPISAGMVPTMAQLERMAIERALQASGGNREQAAKMLDIGTRTLYRKLKEYELT